MVTHTILTCLLLLHTTLSASESDLTNTGETTKLTIHVPLTYDSHLIRPLLDDQGNKVECSTIELGPKEKEKLPEQFSDDGFAPDLFPNIRSLQIVAAEAVEAERKKIEAYSDLYKALLTHLLPHYSVGTAPEEVTQLKPVGEPGSYTVSVDYNDPKTFSDIAILHLSIHQPYRIHVPVAKPEQEGSLTVRVPLTLKKALGRMEPSLADFISYRKARRDMLKVKLQKRAYALLAASWIGTTIYWMCLDTQHNVTSGEKAGHFFADFFAHVIGGPLTVAYPIEMVVAHRKRIDQRKADIQAATELPMVADVDPQVDCLAEDYISKNLLRDIEILKSRKWFCWLCCCPIFNGIERILKKPFNDAPELERIPIILKISHRRLTEKLVAEQQGDNASKIAAQRIQNAYNTMLTNLYQLNPHNLDAIAGHSAHHLDLTPRRRRTLQRTMERARIALTACMPQRIRSLARSEG